MKIFSAPRRLLGLSLPARAALLVAIFLMICVFTAYMGFLATGQHADDQLWRSPGRVVLIAVLVLVIPGVVYKALQLWLQGETSRYPDIDHAWQAGLAELEKNGIDITQLPIYLVVGSQDEIQNRSLFQAARLSLNVSETPKGPAPLHWFANPDGIYLVLTQTCRLSALSLLGSSNESQEWAGPSEPAMPASSDIRNTIVPGQMAAEPDESTMPDLGSPDVRGTMNIRGTMALSSSGSGPSQDAGLARVPKNVSLSAGDAAEIGARLDYLCQLILRVRQPLCPINGILTVLPFAMIAKSGFEATQVQKTLKEDMADIRRCLQLRCPVTALVGGMEKEDGFRELVRRVGPDRAKAQRFGKGHGVWIPPTDEQLEALSAQACAAFELWTYTLFRDKDALSKPGNTKLYALLCKIRRQFRNRLANILVDGFGAGQPGQVNEEALLFSGCYFAAIGETEDRQAFVKNVFDKLCEEEEELDWTTDAVESNNWYQRVASIIYTVDGILVVLLVVMLFYWWKK